MCPTQSAVAAYPGNAYQARPVAAPTAVGRERSSPIDRVLRWFLYFAWFHTLYDPHRWIGIGRSESLVVLGVTAVAIIQALRRLDRSWKCLLPFLAFLGACVLGAANAPIPGLVRQLWTLIFQFWVLGVATLLTIQNLRQALPLLLILFFQFPWWLLHGMPFGLVYWHPLLGDENAFAAVMVMGMAWGFHLGRAAHKKWLSRVMTLTAALCIFGLVASLARGAFLAAVAVAALTWLRSPSKGRTTLGILAGVVTLTIASEVMTPGGGFWTEMMTTFEEGASEGTTGDDRVIVWGAATRVWADHPFVGVGLANFGPYAAGTFQPGELRGMYSDPRTLYLKAVHNDFVQLLAETGLIGLGLYLYMLFLFFKKTARLRRADYRRAWEREVPRTFDLVHLSFGFEGAMVALLANSVFYPQLDRIWFWGLLAFLWLIYHRVEELVKKERRIARHRQHYSTA